MFYYDVHTQPVIILHCLFNKFDSFVKAVTTENANVIWTLMTFTEFEMKSDLIQKQNNNGNEKYSILQLKFVF